VREYRLIEKGYTDPINFDIAGLDMTKYASMMYEKDRISKDMTVKEKNIDHIKQQVQFSPFMLVGEIARYLNISPLLVSRILKECAEGEEVVVNAVNKYNDILFDVVIPAIFNGLFEIEGTTKTVEREMVLLREPKDAGYYVFKGRPELMLRNTDPQFSQTEAEKSFHADKYIFDSKPEKECFLQYITSPKVRKVYFTGMFTHNQGDFSIHYYDPESGRIRQYHPDFFVEMEDDTFQLVEVKGDHLIDDRVTQAKIQAAMDMTTQGKVEYRLLPSSIVESTRILGDSTQIGFS